MTTPVSQSVDSLSGRTSTGPFITQVFDRAPTTNDMGYLVGQRWVDTSDSNAEWFLLNFQASNGVVTANWVQLGSGSDTLETLTGNSGGPVTADGSLNINVVGNGTTGILFSGSGSTLTGTLNAIPNSALAHSSVTLSSGTGISVSGSPVSLGASATVNVATTVPLSFATGSGTATPSSNSLTVAGAGGITTSGSGSTVTVTAGTTIPTSIVTDSGTATPSSNALVLHGTNGVTTSASGNTITIQQSGDVYAFLAKVTSTKTNVTGDNTVYTVIFDTISADTTGGDYDATTGVFTAETTGFYEMAACLLISGVSVSHTTGKMIFAVNNSNQIDSLRGDYYNMSDAGGNFGISLSTIYYLNAGDTVRLWLQIDGVAKTISVRGTTAETNDVSHFTVGLL